MPSEIARDRDPLSLFHPLVRRWFEERVGVPTDVQARAWPEIAAGRHVLVSAPTGSGKTLTAFLWAINQLVTGALERGSAAGAIRVLYVSPLKALNNDIRRNLLRPLAELKEAFERAGQEFFRHQRLRAHGLLRPPSGGISFAVQGHALAAVRADERDNDREDQWPAGPEERISRAAAAGFQSDRRLQGHQAVENMKTRRVRSSQSAAPQPYASTDRNRRPFSKPSFALNAPSSCSMESTPL